MNPSFWRSRRVFVTGHTGFKGGWLSLWLSRAGAEIVGLSNGIPTQPSLYEAAAIPELLTAIVGDVRDRELFVSSIEHHRPEIVFHLAAQPLVRRSLAEPVQTYETNVIGTMNLIEAVRAVDSVRAVVVVTTDKVYEPIEGRPYREGDRLGGNDPYSSSKACAELVAAAYRSSYFQHEGAPAIATARAGNVIGGGDWGEDRLVPDLIRALTAGVAVEIRYPEAIRPWQHVLDAIEGYLLLAERLWVDRGFARAWNFGPDQSETRAVKWIVERVAEQWGASLEVRGPESEQPTEALSLELDAGRARNELGWRPRWDIESGLRATVDWYWEYVAGRSGRELTLAQIDAFAADREPLRVTT